MLFSKIARQTHAINQLTTAELEAILKARKASEPSFFDGIITSLDSAQMSVRTTVADGLDAVASRLKP